MSGAKARAAARVRFQSGQIALVGPLRWRFCRGSRRKRGRRARGGNRLFSVPARPFRAPAFPEATPAEAPAGRSGAAEPAALPRGVPPFREGRGVPRRKDRPGRVPRPVSARESRLRRRGMRVRSRQGRRPPRRAATACRATRPSRVCRAGRATGCGSLPETEEIRREGRAVQDKEGVSMIFTPFSTINRDGRSGNREKRVQSGTGKGVLCLTFPGHSRIENKRTWREKTPEVCHVWYRNAGTSHHPCARSARL